MDAAKKVRRVLRSTFTRHHKNVIELIDANKTQEARAAFNILVRDWQKLREKDEEILTLMIDSDRSEEDIEKESVSTDSYSNQYEVVSVLIQDIEAGRLKESPSTCSGHNQDETRDDKVLKLPPLNIGTFDGDLKKWLPFWGQFEVIHEDEKIPTVHKYRLLVGSMKEGSTARQVVESFPPSKDGKSYDAAISALKERFAREDLLIEVYVRELLGIIIRNSTSQNFSVNEMYDKLECHLRFLELLGVTSGKCAAILCPLLESCMPEEFLRVWQRSCDPSEVKDAEQRLQKFREFIKAEVQNEQRISLALSKFGISDSDNQKPRRENRNLETGRRSRPDVPSATSLLTAHAGNKLSCVFCDNTSHDGTNCYRARNMAIEDKLKQVRDKKYCFLCLAAKHSSKFCQKPTCPLCDKRHAVVICPNYSHNKGFPNKSTVPVSSAKYVSGDTSTGIAATNVASNTSLACDSGVLLPTVQVKLVGPDGRTRIVRAVFDTAAQRSYLLDSTAIALNLKAEGQEKLFHSLFGGRQTGMKIHNKYNIVLHNSSGGIVCNMDVLGLDIICGKLPTLQKGPWIKEIASFGLEPADFLNDSGTIELLIGADYAYSLYTGNIHKMSYGSIVVVETVLGWTLSGKLPQEYTSSSLGMLTTTMVVENMTAADLWKLDIIGIEDPGERKTAAEVEAQVQRDFLESLIVNEEQRYEVCLPWKEDHPPLPSNFELAKKRLDSTYKKLENLGQLVEYQKVFEDWMSEGVIERVSPSEYFDGGHYLPHRPIFKDSSTTKTRPVYDASACEKDQPCLNFCLEKGGNLIEQIPPLLHRFRMKAIGVTGDIRRAFLQISVRPADRNFLLFLWRDENGQLIVYRHRRVVFGLTCSPFLLGAVIQNHLDVTLEKIKIGASNVSESTIKTLRKCFYVDNAVASFDTKEELDEFISEATAVMAEGNFELRGWEFSDPSCDEPANTPLLGLVWNRRNDDLSISKESLNLPTGKITKRVIMRVAHTIYDPLGFVSPVTLYPKLLMKELWKTQLQWDDEVPKEIRDRFLNWAEELRILSNVKIPRWLYNMTNVTNVSLHTFCDASNSAYAAVIFLRVENSEGISVQLVQSKARVAQNMTIPRKELLSALMAARLFASVQENFDSCPDLYFWSDSATVLAWLRRPENWTPFVSRRVNEIRELTPVEKWNHVPGLQNPADLPSRGCTAKALFESKWWEGPEWLFRPKTQWPSSPSLYDEEQISLEKRKPVVSALISTTGSPDWYYRYFSKYTKLVRMTAWILRFAHNVKSFGSEHFVKRRGPLSVEEIHDAELKVLKMAQNDGFSGLNDPAITPLLPFEDHIGLIRLKTKISNRPDSEDFRHPILLPRGHPVVDRLIRYVHEKECHVGVQGLLAILRERYWVTGGRRTIKSVISRCVTCRRHESKRLEAPTVPLPIDRVRQALAFEVVGVDLAGPIYLKGRQKAWICLFTCAVTRAVHLELLLSPSTDEFLLGLRRFIARRGRPAKIYSDQGSNFVGTVNLFEKINWEKVLQYATTDRIVWRFNPPTASWWGGWWERLIGMMKRLLRKVLRRSTLSFSEMQTVLCDCEGVLNSRPLTFMSSGANEPIPISPSLFIQDIKEVGLPELDVIESVDLKKMLQHRLKLKEDFRARFRNEYLGLLQMRHRSSRDNAVKVGDVVLIGHDQTKRIDWPLAIVSELLPGKEGIVHLVRLKTTAGSCLRPIQRLYPLLEADIPFVADKKENVPESEAQHLNEMETGLDTSITQHQNLNKDDQAFDKPQDLKSTSRGRTIKRPQRFCD